MSETEILLVTKVWKEA